MYIREGLPENAPPEYLEELTMRQRFKISGDLFNYMVYDVKAPLTEALNLFFSPNPIDKINAAIKMRKSIKGMSGLPEPTKTNTVKHNSHILIEIRDEFCKRIKLNEPRLNAIRAMFNFIIILYEFDQPYEQLIDWAVTKILDSDWVRIGDNRPNIKIWLQDWEFENVL